MEQALYRRWRPATFDEVVGQEHVVRTIQNALASGRFVHAYLFSGPRGTGKTTMARLVAKALNCLQADPALRPDNTCRHCLAVNEGRFLDLIEIDAASNTGVDNIRDLRDKINFSPSEGRYKIYIIDEVHMLSMGAFNALLKTLEEPPPHAVFILATTEIHKVPLTVASRCQKHTFRRIPLAEMIGRLQAIVGREELRVEPAVLEVVARQATGSLRDAISLLDQLISGPEETVTLEGALATLGAAGRGDVEELAEALLAQDAGRGLDLINRVVEGGADPRQFSRQMVDYLRGLLLIRLGNPALVEAHAGAEMLQVMQGQAQRFETRQLLRALKAVNDAASGGRGGWLGQLPLELALVESLSSLDPPAEEVGPAPPARQASPRGAAAVAEAAPARSASAASLGQIAARWKEIATASRRHHHSLQGLLNSCRPVKVEGDTLVLGFQSDLVLSKANTAQNLQWMEETLREVMGVPLRVRCTLSRVGGDPPADISDNGMVAEAIRLGGRLRK